MASEATDIAADRVPANADTGTLKPVKTDIDFVCKTKQDGSILFLIVLHAKQM